MSSSFSATTSSVHSIPFGPPSAPAIASTATGTGDLTEKSLELTFCAQFVAENAYHHHVPWPHRIVWFGLTQLQENHLGFDAVTSLGGLAMIFQFKASHAVTKKRGRRFKVEHEQMVILRNSFGQHPGTCFYVFPDVGNVNELAAVHSNVVGHSRLLDVTDLPDPIPPPYKRTGGALRKDHCHFAYLGNPTGGTIEFHSQPFSVRAHKAKEIAQRMPFRDTVLRTEDVVRLLKKMDARSPMASRRFFRNTVMAVLTEPF